nr:hypothetical protein [Tanacetum cinerariifolium]
MIQFPGLSMESKSVLIHLHNAISIYTCVRDVQAILTMVMNVRNESRLSMSRNRATLKTLMIITIHMTCQIPVCYDDDDDEERSNSLQDNIISGLPPCSAITPNEPVDSLSMGDEHLNTISATKSDEFIKSYVENLVPNLSESEGEKGCDLPACFRTFLNILFDADYESDSSDYQSCSDEDFSKEIYSNPLFKEEIIPMKIDQHHFNAESDLLESMLNHDSSIISSSSKIDSLLDEFIGKLTLYKSILPGIDKTDCYPEEDILLIERLLYDNSSPRPSEEFVFDNSDADIESFSPSPIPIEDSDSRMEEIDLTFTPDDPMPPSIEENDYDSKRDILILEELPSNYSLSLPEIESFYFDIPSFSRPPAKPPDGNTGMLNIKMMGDVSDQKVPIPGLMFTRVSNQEKSPNLLSHRGFENFQLSAKRPMTIHGKNIPILDFVQYSGKFEDSCQRILSSKSSFPQLQLGIILLHLAGSQPMLKSSYKAEDGVIISITPLVGGVADVVVEIKGTVISRGGVRFLDFLSAYFIALREDTQEFSMGDFGERKTRKGQNQNQTRQKREAWKSPAVSKANHSRESRKKKTIQSSRDQRCKS